MKLIPISILLFIFCGTFVFAQEGESPLPLPQKREEIKQRIEEKKVELKAQIEEKREDIKNQINVENGSVKTKLQIFAQERVSKIISHIFEKFEAVLVKFDGIVLRIENRISKLQEQGIDTSDSEELLLNAKSNIEESTALITATKLELETAIATEVSKEQIKIAVDACKVSLKMTQEALVQVIISLKALGGFEEQISFE